MEYTNSPLAVYTRLSPSNSGPRKHAIDRITPHMFVGQLPLEEMWYTFGDPNEGVSANYAVDVHGRIGVFADESIRSWCSSNPENDDRAITIECASDKAPPWTIRDAVFASLIDLCEDICRRHGKKKLLWLADRAKTLAYDPAPDEMVLTIHKWFIDTECPGEWMMDHMGELAVRVTARLSDVPEKSVGDIPPADAPGPEPDEAPEIVSPPADALAYDGLQGADLADLSDYSVIQRVAPLFIADQQRSGILASVSLAQFLLETGFGKRSELFRQANNAFGMKCPLSGNTWPGSTWDGESMYPMDTPEQWKDGTWHTIRDDFRAYTCMEDSIADHSAYLLGAMNGDKLRYAGLRGCADYRRACEIIQAGEYATSLTYAEELIEIIDMWNLTQYDLPTATPASVSQPTAEPYPSASPAVHFTVDQIRALNEHLAGISSILDQAVDSNGKGVGT